MSTILGVESRDGVVVAADRRRVESGVVTSEGVDRASDLEDVAFAAVGDPGDVDAFRRTFEAELDRYEHEHDERPGVDVVAELAGSVASTTGVRALVAGRTEDGDAGLRSVDADGGIYRDDRAALGSGTGPALAALDAVTVDAPIDEVAAALRDVFESVGERDPDTGADVDVVTVTAD